MKFYQSALVNFCGCCYVCSSQHLCAAAAVHFGPRSNLWCIVVAFIPVSNFHRVDSICTVLGLLNKHLVLVRSFLLLHGQAHNV